MFVRDLSNRPSAVGGQHARSFVNNKLLAIRDGIDSVFLGGFLDFLECFFFFWKCRVRFVRNLLLVDIRLAADFSSGDSNRIVYDVLRIFS